MQEYLKEKDLQQLVQKITKILQAKNKCVIAIDGKCASGKSTLALEVSRFFDCRIFHLDDFYLPRGTKDLTKSVDGNIDLNRFKTEIINHLNDNTLLYRPFSCQKQAIVSCESIKYQPLTIVEGSYSLNPHFGKYYDLSIYMTIDESVQINRLKMRNLSNFSDFLEKWIVLENRYNNFYKISNNADIVLENNL